MSFLAALPIIGDLFKGIKDLASEAITDKDKKIEFQSKIKMVEAETKAKVLQMESDEKIAQMEINKEEAKSKMLFVSGWRPFIGWTCGVAFGCNFIFIPLMGWALPILSVWYPEAKDIIPPPTFSLGEMMPVLLGMLGLGGYRTYEKFKGVNNK